MDALSNDVRVSAKPDDDAPAPAPQNGAGVLSQLPRTRPQRTSARRAAAREGGGAARRGPASAPGHAPEPERTARPKATGKRSGAAKRSAGAGAGGGTPRKPAAARKQASKRKPTGATRSGTARKSATQSRERSSRARSAPRVRGRAPDDTVPSQGFATEGERVTGPVAPPGGAELFATAAEIVTELARASVSSGERFVRDLLSRLPLN